MKFFNSFGLLVTLLLHLSWCLAHAVAPAPTALAVLENRADDDSVRFACDYLTANPKYNTASNHHNLNCRLDPARGLWGVCGSGIDRIADCGIAGACVDGGGCKSGCGFMGQPVTTVTCSDKVVCSSAFVFYGSRDYKYIGCGTTDRVDSYTLSPTGSANTAATAADSSGDTSVSGDIPAQTSTPAIDNTFMATVQASASKGKATSSSSSVRTGSSTIIPPTEEAKSPTKHFNPTSVIIGASIGGAALLSICIAGACLLYRRRKRKWYLSAQIKRAKSVKNETTDRSDIVWSLQPALTTGQQASVMSEGTIRYELEG